LIPFGFPAWFSCCETSAAPPDLTNVAAGEFLCDEFCASNCFKEYSVSNTIFLEKKFDNVEEIFFFGGEFHHGWMVFLII
jgi:hypothetical protein